MTGQKIPTKFSQIYEATYNDVLKYVIFRCKDINDVNDIIQETYLDFWYALNNLKQIDDAKKYLIGIATNKLKKYYSGIKKLKYISLFTKNEDDLELIDSIKSDIDIEQIVLKKADYENIWKYIKKKRNKDIPKIFYLHYKLDLTIKEIAVELNVNESYIKNIIYRTLNELYLNFKK